VFNYLSFSVAVNTKHLRCSLCWEHFGIIALVCNKMWISLYLGPQCFCCTILRDVIFVEACSASVISTTCIYNMQWYAGSPQPALRGQRHQIASLCSFLLALATHLTLLDSAPAPPRLLLNHLLHLAPAQVAPARPPPRSLPPHPAAPAQLRQRASNCHLAPAPSRPVLRPDSPNQHPAGSRPPLWPSSPPSSTPSRNPTCSAHQRARPAQLALHPPAPSRRSTPAQAAPQLCPKPVPAQLHAPHPAHHPAGPPPTSTPPLHPARTPAAARLTTPAKAGPNRLKLVYFQRDPILTP
jgi:hypothetical protein